MCGRDLAQRLERAHRALRGERHRRRRAREDHERHLLEPDAPCRATPPAHGAADAAERVDVEEDEQRGQHHPARLAGERERGAGERPADARRPARPRHVREQRREEEEPGEHIAPLRRPRHRLDAQRMHAPEERRGDRAGEPAPGGHVGARQQPLGEHGEEAGVRGVQQQAAQVESAGVESPEPVVEREGEPGERLPVPEMEGGQHPAQVRWSEAADPRVDDQALGVVEVDEAVLQDGQEGERRHGGHGEPRRESNSIWGHRRAALPRVPRAGNRRRRVVPRVAALTTLC